MKNILLVVALIVLSSTVYYVFSSTGVSGEPVTTANYVRAESDMQMKAYTENFESFGKFHHSRAMYDVTKQLTIRPNTDTLYSFGIFDLTSPLELKMPTTDRYQSAMIVSEDHSLYALYEGDYVITENDIGSRYVFILLRTFVDPNDIKDLEEAHQVQDMVEVSQEAVGSFDVPNWDEESLTSKRKELVAIASLLPNSQGMYGNKEQLDPVRHLLGAAYGWGGLPEADASYDLGASVNNDGKTVHSLTVRDVPVKGFWSVTVYNKDGYFDVNDRDVYSLNSKTVKPNSDGSITVQFGNCENIDNCLEIMNGWNYAIRMYQPEEDILDGTWAFPQPTPK